MALHGDDDCYVFARQRASILHMQSGQNVLNILENKNSKKISIGDQDSAQVRKQCTITMLVYRAKLSPSNLRLPYNARFYGQQSPPAPLPPLHPGAAFPLRPCARRRCAPPPRQPPPRRCCSPSARRSSTATARSARHPRARPPRREAPPLLAVRRPTRILASVGACRRRPAPASACEKSVASPAREAKQAPLRPQERRALRPFARQGSETSAASSARQAAGDERSRPASSRRSVPRRSRAPRPLVRPATQPIRV